MVIPERFPHNLYVFTQQDGSVNSDGDVVPGTPEWINVSVCREEKRTGTSKYLNDGTAFDFTSMIFTPAECDELSKGTQFEVREGSNVRASGSVKLFDKGANHCRIWV